MRLDFSLEYRVPIYDKIIWSAFFIDAVNLLNGPTSDTAWQWWNNKDGMGINNWYFSIGAGVEITFPQLPLSFFVIKRFKLNYFSGIEWQTTQSTNVDLVLSMVGFYF
jgi:outer membrane protein assembly factor BamA